MHVQRPVATATFDDAAPPDLPSSIWALIAQHARGTSPTWRTVNALCRASHMALADVFQGQTADLGQTPPPLGVSLDNLVELAVAVPRAERVAALARFGRRFTTARALRLTSHTPNGCAGIAYFFDNLAEYLPAVQSLQLKVADQFRGDCLWRLLPTAPFSATVRHLHASLRYSSLQSLCRSLCHYLPSLRTAHFVVTEWNDDHSGNFPEGITHLSVNGPPELTTLTVEGASSENELVGDESEIPTLHVRFVSNRGGGKAPLQVVAVPSLQRLVLHPYLGDGDTQAWHSTLPSSVSLPALQELDACLPTHLLTSLQRMCPALARLTLQGVYMADDSLEAMVEALAALRGQLLELHMVLGKGRQRADRAVAVQAQLKGAMRQHLPNTTLMVSPG